MILFNGYSFITQIVFYEFFRNFVKFIQLFSMLRAYWTKRTLICSIFNLNRSNYKKIYSFFNY